MELLAKSIWVIHLYNLHILRDVLDNQYHLNDQYVNATAAVMTEMMKVTVMVMTTVWVVIHGDVFLPVGFVDVAQSLQGDFYTIAWSGFLRGAPVCLFCSVRPFGWAACDASAE